MLGGERGVHHGGLRGRRFDPPIRPIHHASEGNDAVRVLCGGDTSECKILQTLPAMDAGLVGEKSGFRFDVFGIG
jgi:hypothetical protein